MDWNKHLPSILAWGGSLLTGVFTLLGVWLANRSSYKQLTEKLRHESARETREILRQRLEELYTLIGQWSNELSTHYLPYLKVMDGELSYNDALDITLRGNSRVDANRMFTLAELYFPGAHDALEVLISCRDKAASLHSDFKEQYRIAGEPSQKHAKLLRRLLGEFDRAVEHYRRELAAYAKNV
jgi:hypothetical protein